jgi:hypothetical protein
LKIKKKEGRRKKKENIKKDQCEALIFLVLVINLPITHYLQPNYHFTMNGDAIPKED